MLAVTARVRKDWKGWRFPVYFAANAEWNQHRCPGTRAPLRPGNTRGSPALPGAGPGAAPPRQRFHFRPGAVCVRVVLAVPSAADTARARSRPRRDTRFWERGGGGVFPR